MNVDAGALDKRIQIIRVRTEKDSDGYETRTETIVRSPWAQFSQTSASTLVQANADTGETRGRFLIRWTATVISRKDLVRYAGQDWEIEYINPYGDAREYVELLCRRTTLEG